MNTIDSELTETVTSDTALSACKPLIIKTYSHNDKKQLVKRMNDIKNKKCYIKIFKVIHGSTKYTVNDNGVLFNLTVLPDNVLTQIEAIIQHYEDKKYINESHLKSISSNKISNDTEENMSSEIMDTIKTKKQNNINQQTETSNLTKSSQQIQSTQSNVNTI